MDISNTAKTVFKRCGISNNLDGSENGMVFEHVPRTIREINEEIAHQNDNASDEDDFDDEDDDEV